MSVCLALFGNLCNIALLYDKLRQKEMLYPPSPEDTAFLYVMAFLPCLLSGLDRATALAWSKAQWVITGCFPAVFLDYKAYYSGDLCAEFKRVLNELETSF